MNQPNKPATFDLVAGFSFLNPKNASALLSVLYRFRDECRLKSVVLIGDSTQFRALSQLLRRIRGKGIGVRYVSDDEVRKSASKGAFGEFYIQPARQTGVAYFRTALHHYLYLEALRSPRPVVWVLDDDVRLPTSLFRGRRSKGSFARLVSGFMSEGVDVAVGRVSGDPPIPGASMIRTQLLDLDFNLRALGNPDFKINPRAQMRQNRENAEKYHDFYYDLTLSHNGHLETPWHYTGNSGSTNRAALLEEMLGRLPQIATGVNIFRPLSRPQSN